VLGAWARCAPAWRASSEGRIHPGAGWRAARCEEVEGISGYLWEVSGGSEGQGLRGARASPLASFACGPAGSQKLQMARSRRGEASDTAGPGIGWAGGGRAGAARAAAAGARSRRCARSACHAVPLGQRWGPGGPRPPQPPHAGAPALGLACNWRGKRCRRGSSTPPRPPTPKPRPLVPPAGSPPPAMLAPCPPPPRPRPAHPIAHRCPDPLPALRLPARLHCNPSHRSRPLPAKTFAPSALHPRRAGRARRAAPQPRVRGRVGLRACMQACRQQMGLLRRGLLAAWEQRNSTIMGLPEGGGGGGPAPAPRGGRAARRPSQRVAQKARARWGAEPPGVAA
jgi:hypothetical protein